MKDRIVFGFKVVNFDDETTVLGSGEHTYYGFVQAENFKDAMAQLEDYFDCLCSVELEWISNDMIICNKEIYDDIRDELTF